MGARHDRFQLVVHLSFHPGAGGGAERLLKAQRHLRRDTGSPVQKVAKGLTVAPEHLCGVGDGQAVGIKAFLADKDSGMGHVCSYSWSDCRVTIDAYQQDWSAG